MKLTDIITEYLENCKADGKSVDTLNSYAQTLNSYAKFTDEISPAALLAYKKSLNVKPSTLKLYFVHLHNLFKWAEEVGYIERSPCIEAVMPHVATPHKPYQNLLTQKDVGMIVSANRPKTKRAGTWERDKAITIMFLTTGMRNSELCAVSENDLDWVNGTISIQSGKGGKFRLVAFPAISQYLVKEYLKSGYRPRVSAEQPLFGISEGGWHGFERVGMSGLVERTIEGITGKKGIRSHALRHSCASLMLTNGMSKANIQSLLGHSSAATTERYAELLNPKAPTDCANQMFKLA